MPRGRPKWRRIRDVLVTDYDMLLSSMPDPDHISLLAEAIDQAKKSPERFGWAGSGKALVTCDLDEPGARLISARFFTLAGDYLDPKLTGEYKYREDGG
jgi:hypothetical protein